MATKTKKARVLHKFALDEIEYQPNEVIEADVELINGLEKAGSVDAKQAAVKYCVEHEGAQVRVHAPAADVQDEAPADNAPADDAAGDSASDADGNPNA